MTDEIRVIDSDLKITVEPIRKNKDKGKNKKNFWKWFRPRAGE